MWSVDVFPCVLVLEGGVWLIGASWRVAVGFGLEVHLGREVLEGCVCFEVLEGCFSASLALQIQVWGGHCCSPPLLDS